MVRLLDESNRTLLIDNRKFSNHDLKEFLYR